VGRRSDALVAVFARPLDGIKAITQIAMEPPALNDESTE
jgi:hypothetical protein